MTREQLELQELGEALKAGKIEKDAKKQNAREQLVTNLGGVTGATFGAGVVWVVDNVLNAVGSSAGVNLDIVDNPAEHTGLVLICYKIGEWLFARAIKAANTYPWAGRAAQFIGRMARPKDA